MAGFPELEPAARSYDFGAIPLTRSGTVRFRHSITETNYQLTLGYQALTDAEATLIRNHYGLQGGGNISFTLPAIIWRGHTFSGNIAPPRMLWRYASPPEEEHFSAGYVNVSVPLVSDGVINSSMGTIQCSIVGGTGYTTGFARTVTASLAASGAGGGASGASITVTASLAEGAATGA